MSPDDFSCAKAHAIFDATKDLVFPIDATVNAHWGEIFYAEKYSLFENLDQLLGPFAKTGTRITLAL